MNGTFHHYRHHVRWKRSPRTAQVVLATKESVFVCFRPTKVELSWSTPPPTVRALGPDLALGPPEPARLAERLRTAAERSPRIDDILLDQQICSGIGNVYKSEILFIGQVSPERSLNELSETQILDLFVMGSRLLRDNLEGGAKSHDSLRPLRARFSGLQSMGLWPSQSALLPVPNPYFPRHHGKTDPGDLLVPSVSSLAPPL